MTTFMKNRKTYPRRFTIGLATAMAILFLNFTLPQPFRGHILGKVHVHEKDFTCCKGDQLMVHHYYNFTILFVNVDSGYDIEPIGKPNKGGCIIQCDE